MSYTKLWTIGFGHFYRLLGVTSNKIITATRDILLSVWSSSKRNVIWERHSQQGKSRDQSLSLFFFPLTKCIYLVFARGTERVPALLQTCHINPTLPVLNSHYISIRQSQSLGTGQLSYTRRPFHRPHQEYLDLVTPYRTGNVPDEKPFLSLLFE